MNNQMQGFGHQTAITPITTGATGGCEIGAVALLKLIMRAEAAAAEPAGSESLPIGDQPEVAINLSPYLQDELTAISVAIFNRANGDFYRAYRGLSPEDASEILLSKEDLRPLAYRALMYEGPVTDRPFAPRFAASLLLLQKYWDCEFFQPYKDAAGRLSACSLARAPGRLVF